MKNKKVLVLICVAGGIIFLAQGYLFYFADCQIVKTFYTITHTPARCIIIPPTELPAEPEPAPVVAEKLPEAVQDTKQKSFWAGVKQEEDEGDYLGTAINYENIFNGVNKERYSAGLKKLERSEVLDQVASDKLQDLLEYNYWSHTNPTTGAVPWFWFKKENYIYRYVGENLARNYQTAQETVAGWMSSETHKANILKAQYEETGIAISGSLVVQVFGVR